MMPRRFSLFPDQSSCKYMQECFVVWYDIVYEQPSSFMGSGLLLTHLAWYVSERGSRERKDRRDERRESGFSKKRTRSRSRKRR